MGSEARARLGLAALLSVTLVGFSRVFQEGDYPGPAMLGMLIAVGITLLCRRIGLASWVSLVVSVGTLGWYLCLVFAASNTFFGLPTIGAFRQIGEHVQRAYVLSNVDYAPVPLRPGYVLMMVAAMWVLATLGEIATFRWRQPLVVAIASAAMFSFVLIVGIPDGAQFFTVLFLLGLLTYLGLESAHRLRSWGRWVSAWSARRWDTEVTTGPLARKMGASCLAAAIVAPVFLPAIGSGLLSWRSPTGPGGGGGRIDTLVSLAPKLVQQSDDILFSVDAPQASYWRLVTLTLFDGESWHPEANRESMSNGRVASEVPAPQPGVDLLQHYEVEGLEGELVPAVSLPESVTIQGEEADEYNDALEFNPVTGDVELNKPLVEGLEYQVRSLTPNVNFASMNDSTIPSIQDVESSAGLPTFLPENVYEVPKDFCPPAQGQNDCPLQNSRIYRIAQRWSEQGETGFEKLLLLQNRFRGTYLHQLPGKAEVDEVEVKALASADYLVEFLTETKTGYCQQFATAFAVLARMLGYPARVSVGFLPGETSIERPNHYVVRGNDAHAWPEVYFNEVGWVAFEPTPRQAAPPPAYTLQQNPGAGVNPPALDPAAERGNRRGQGPGGFRDPAEVRPGRANAAREQRTDPDAWQDSFLRLLQIFGGLAAIWLIGIPLVKFVLNRRRYRRAKTPSAVAGAAFAEFEQVASDLASARSPAESAHTYVGRLIKMQRVPPRPALRLIELFEAATYGPLAISEAQGAEAVKLAHSLRTELWRDAGWIQRAGALFSPAAVLAEVSPNGQRGGVLGSLQAGLARGLTRPAARPR